MVEIWEKHMAAEFKTKNIDATMATMTSDPYVNHVPVMTGGVGYDEVRRFYNTYFIPGQPPDTDVVPVTRTVGKDRIVDELIHKFTHTIEMPMDSSRCTAYGQASRNCRRRGCPVQRWKDRRGAHLLGPSLRPCSGRID